MGDSDGDDAPTGSRLVGSFTAPKDLLEEAALAGQGDDDDPFKDTRVKTIAEQESAYQARRRNRVMPAERVDATTGMGGEGASSYADVMKERILNQEQADLKKALAEKEAKEKEEREAKVNANGEVAVPMPTPEGSTVTTFTKPERKRRR